MKEIIIREEFFDMTVRCFFGPHTELGGVIEEHYGEEMAEAVEHVDEDYRGTCIMMPTGELVLWMQSVPTEAISIGTLAHEALHITNHVLGEVQGIPFTSDTEEVYSLMVGRIVEKVLTQLQTSN